AVLELFTQPLHRQRVGAGASQGLVDLAGKDLATDGRHLYLGAEVIGGRKLRGGVCGGMDARQDHPYRRIAEGITLEVLDADRTVSERARQAVLHAELRLEPALRVGTVGVLEAPRVRPTFDARNRLLPQVMAAHEIEHDVERRMGAAATGILLDGDAGLDDVERRTPVREDARGVVGSWPIEDFQKTLVVLKLAGIGGEISLGEQR